MHFLYHLVSESDWMSFEGKDSYCPLSLESEGFIHLSTKPQLLETAELFFKDKKGLLVLKIEIPDTDLKLKWEYSPERDEEFPHYYGALSRDRIQEISPFSSSL